MSGEESFYPRTILTLEAIKEEQEDTIPDIVSNLQSPLRLALILIDGIFTDGGQHLKDYSDAIDETKKVAFGLGSAEKLGFEPTLDKLARYSIYQFAFQQYVHRSFEARQGKALEKILAKILSTGQLGITPVIATKKDKKKKILKEILGSEDEAKELLDKHDIDILAEVGNKVIVFQMRSRDDTGGATAKSSLAELLRELYEHDLEKEVLYVIYIWVKPEGGAQPQQKVTLINKILPMVNIRGEKAEKIKAKLKNGEVAKLKDKLKVCVVYGAGELISTLWAELGIRVEEGEEMTNYEKTLKEYSEYLELLSSWDDLWLSYAVATLELENLVKHGKTNAVILEEKLSPELKEKLKSSACLENYRNCSAEIAMQLSPLIRGEDDIIPFGAIGDKVNYLRDLILLRMVYEHLERILDVVGADDKTRKRLQKLQKDKNEENSGQVTIDDFVKK